MLFIKSGFLNYEKKRESCSLLNHVSKKNIKKTDKIIYY